ncbi:hypothetical protein HG535_0B01680 [Zygotorulaspora mrakii]|uniref:methylated diphthine methylhydrolase n=1 Tax=Zygotorulaspora mrakii TaxID=42260 RepID=A0A7H9AXI6_ZYGMR|nr:uncharacterized protein HG535_0B01680 [Zygotorulaspora mrakii]QLG71130.1 hypothetical protein HG535_0B01680 [Zygotorulaspora mrakii]
MEESKIIKATTTQLPPCCLRIVDNEYILVGSYHLDKPSGKRTGLMEIFDRNLELTNSYPTYGAILDLKLSPFDTNLVATAHSTGNVTVWKFTLTKDKKSVELRQLGNLQVFDVNILVTSLQFSPLDSRILLATNTLGTSAIIDLVDESVTFSIDSTATTYQRLVKTSYNVQGSFENAMEVKARKFAGKHALECWTGEFGQLQPLQNVVFTGGDDATIMAHDLRTKATVWSNNRIHEAGVVGIKTSSPTFRNSKSTSIITGSYDDKIRSLDLRMLGDDIYPGHNTPVAKQWDCDLGGGVWRFSEMPSNLTRTFSEAPSNSNKLLVCCMYNGAKVVDVAEDSEDMFRVTNYLKKGHESMCYGGDWCTDFIATCSFYDNSLQIWNL